VKHRYLLALRSALLNITGAAVFAGAAALGIPQSAIQADGTGLTLLIGGVFLIGLLLAILKALVISAEINDAKDGVRPEWYTGHDEDDALHVFHRIASVRNIANLLVLLGLIGTVLGFIIALSGVDPKAVGDVSAIGPMVAQLVAGMATALYTTLAGAVLNVWLMLNYNMLAGGCVKLLRAVGRIGA